MGQAFGADFSAIRVHHDAEGGRLASMLQADAFTYGRDVYFAPGRFDHSTPSGQHLIAHELAHIVQEPATAGGAPPTVGRVADPAEARADRAADSALTRLRRQQPLEPRTPRHASLRPGSCSVPRQWHAIVGPNIWNSSLSVCMLPRQRMRSLSNFQGSETSVRAVTQSMYFVT